MKHFNNKTRARAFSTVAAVAVGAGVIAGVATPAQAVTNGDTVAQGQYPWYTAVPVSNGTKCGGALIAPDWVITVAHCVSGLATGQAAVEVGTFDYSNHAGEERSVVRQVVLPNASMGRGEAPDVALLRIDRVKAKPIALAEPVYAGEQVITAGMGEGSDGKLKSTILAVERQEPTGARTISKGVKVHTFNGPGDSGCPVFVNSPQGPELFGVHSISLTVGDPWTTGRRYSGDTDVASTPALRDWVKQTTGASTGTTDYDISAKSTAGLYLSARLENSAKAMFSNTFVSDWERFRLINNADYTVSLLARANNKYVTAPPTGDAVTASRDLAQDWEKFVPVYSPNGKVSLRAISNNKYLSIASNGELRATSPTADASTQFDMSWDAQNVIGKDMDVSAASSSGRYLSARIEYPNAPTTFTAGAVDTWERFKLIHHSDGTVSMKANANNKYLTAPPSGETVTATAGVIQAWEKFVPAYSADGKISLRAVSNNRYLTITGNGEMHATASTPDPTTQFTLG